MTSDEVFNGRTEGVAFTIANLEAERRDNASEKRKERMSIG
jgi:hypothetical protein